MEKFLEDLAEAMEGGNSIGHHSLVVSVCKQHNHEILAWDTALGLLQENDFELEECEECGWVVEDVFDEAGRCADCSKYSD